MPVAEGVDHQDVDIGGHEEEVLAEGGEHVPGVEVEEGGDEVETEGGGNGDEDDARAAGGEEGFHDFVCVFAREAQAVGEGVDDEIDGVDDYVELHDAEEDEGGDVADFASFGSVSQCEDELEQNEAEVEVFDYCVDNGCGCVSERPGAKVVGLSWSVTD